MHKACYTGQEREDQNEAACLLRWKLKFGESKMEETMGWKISTISLIYCIKKNCYKYIYTIYMINNNIAVFNCEI